MDSLGTIVLDPKIEIQVPRHIPPITEPPASAAPAPRKLHSRAPIEVTLAAPGDRKSVRNPTWENCVLFSCLHTTGLSITHCQSHDTSVDALISLGALLELLHRAVDNLSDLVFRFL